MFRTRKNKAYYYTDHNLQVHEIKRFRSKLATIIVSSVVISVAALLAANHIYYNFLDLGYNRIQNLQQENRILQDQIASLNSTVNDLRSSLVNVEQEGNRLRLLVDLNPVDEDAKAAGTGGAVSIPTIPALLDSANPVLANTMDVLERLSGEVRVQEQSYGQIYKKYEFNKAYFAALPALKPMEGYYSRTGFGLRMHPVLGIFKKHEGLDIINDVGTPVYASGDGVVEMAEHSGGGYGNVVVINHGYGYQTLYAHLSQILVREGRHVKRGDLIAKSGKTGLVTGPHLHYEVRHNGAYQNPIDYFLDDVSAREYQLKMASR